MIGILCEKSTAAANFATALGGQKGTYNGEEYVIVSARGHLYGFLSPHKQVAPSLVDRYKKWSIENLPWDETDLSWSYAPAEGVVDIISKIRTVLSSCSEITIATDNDPTGEGELIAWEILSELALSPKKWSRMYFEDESVKEIRKAFTNRVAITSKDADKEYKKAYYRARWDYLSIQWTRLATCYGDGKSILREGRLKSAMVLLVGDQINAVANYKKIPFYQNKFKDENGVVYTNKDEPIFKDKADVPNKYSQSSVVLDGKKMKSSYPPAMLDLAGLASKLSSKYKSQEVADTYQKMYQDHIVSYPRTEDKCISPEQFNDLLPYVDKIASVVGVDPKLLTHRTPRATHVKTGQAHGANRPGTRVPAKLEDLNQYGSSAMEIYKLLALNYLATLAEDYEYEQQTGHVKDYPDFTGMTNVPKKLGWKLVYRTDDDDEPVSDKGLGTVASPFIYEGFPPKPATPTMKWLMKQLEKYDVGTGATRVNTYNDITNADEKYPILEDHRGKISMTKYGDMSYRLLPGTNIGSLEMTEKLHKDMNDIANGKKDPMEGLHDIQRMIREDMDIMKKNSVSMREQLGIAPNAGAVEKYKGTWHGQEVSFKRVWCGHEFTDDECAQLCAGESIVIEAISPKSGKPFKCKGKLDEQDYKGAKYIGFYKEEYIVDSADRYSGIWNNREVTFKRIWCGHKFTDEECERLCNGEEIEISAVSAKSGKSFRCKGRLAELEYNNRKYIGFDKTDFVNDRSNTDNSDRYTGMWNGKEVNFKKVWNSHKFTEDECKKLCKGDTITVSAVSSKTGKSFKCKGRLEEYTKDGKTYVGFGVVEFVDDSKSEATSDYYTGNWNGREITFKRTWCNHTFTDEECEKLCNGEVIIIEAVSNKTGKPFKCRGHIGEDTYKGKQRVGFISLGFVSNEEGFENKTDIADDNEPVELTKHEESQHKTQGQIINEAAQSEKLPDEWCKHKFTRDERIMLEMGMSITCDDFISAKGNKFKATISYGEDKKGKMTIIPRFE